VRDRADTEVEELSRVRSRGEREIVGGLSPTRSLAFAVAALVLLAVVAGPVVLTDLGPTLGGVLGLAAASPSPTPVPTPTPSPLPTASPTPRPSTTPTARPSPSSFAIDAVAGAGKRLDAAGDTIAEFTIDAETSPEGAAGTYHFHHVPTETTFDGRVTCLAVDGRGAAVGGWMMTVTRPGTTPKAGDAFLVFLLDRGDPLGTHPGPDLVSHTYLLPGDAATVAVPEDFPTTCPEWLTTPHDEYDVTGNVSVTDR